MERYQCRGNNGNGTNAGSTNAIQNGELIMCIIEKFAVAFIDIMGTSEKLKELKESAPPNPYDKLPDKYISLYKDNVCTLKKFRDCFHKNVARAKERVWVRHKHIADLKIEINLAIFSDNILIWTPLRCTESEEECLNLFVLLAALGSSYLELLQDNVYFRGAVCFSHGSEIDGQYYGPGNLSAYEDEKDKALFPRIIVDETIYKIFECKIENAKKIRVIKERRVLLHLQSIQKNSC